VLIQVVTVHVQQDTVDKCVIPVFLDGTGHLQIACAQTVAAILLEQRPVVLSVLIPVVIAHVQLDTVDKCALLAYQDGTGHLLKAAALTVLAILLEQHPVVLSVLIPVVTVHVKQDTVDKCVIHVFWDGFGMKL